MTTELPAGVRSRDVATARLTTRVLEVEGRDDGEPVLLVHGNVSSSLFFVDLLTALPERYRPVAPDLRGYGGTEVLPVDASRGVGDWADDVLALADALGFETFHLLGWSMGGGVAMQVLLDAPQRVRTLTLQAPVSPYGFGGTAGADGRLTSPTAPARAAAAPTRTSSGCSPRARPAPTTPGRRATCCARSTWPAGGCSTARTCTWSRCSPP